MKKRKKASSRSGRNNRKLFIVLLIILIIALVLVVALIYVQSEKIREKGLLYSIADFFSFRWLYSEQLGVMGACGADNPYGCAQGKTCCASSCVDTKTDSANCAGCNNKCDPGWSCVDSKCVCNKVSCGERHGIIDDGCGGTIDCGPVPSSGCDENCNNKNPDGTLKYCGPQTFCGKKVDCSPCGCKKWGDWKLV